MAGAICLRAETFYGMASHIALDGDIASVFPDLHGRSHGQSFLTLIESRFATPGFDVMDEPESARRSRVSCASSGSSATPR